MDWTIAAHIVAFFFALNIGASGTAASMGPVYGSGVVKSRIFAVFLAGICCFAGALAGGEVVKTIGENIIPRDIIYPETVVLILLGASFTLFVANVMGIPLSTSEVVIGSLVGAGLAYENLYVFNLLFILLFWIVIPIASFIISYILSRLFQQATKVWPFFTMSKRGSKILSFLIVMAGMTEAFAAGMNNVANAVGPLTGAGLLSTSSALLYGGLFLALGCVLLGGNVLETNGKKIIPLSVSQGTVVSATSGILVIASSIAGIPVPLTQVSTTAITGVGVAQYGMRLWEKSILKQIVHVWLLSPLVSLVVSYALITVFIYEDVYTFIVIISVFASALGSIHLSQLIKKEKRSFHDEGSGI